MSYTTQETYKQILSKIDILSELRGQSPSSMITLVIPPKYCI